MLEFFSSLGCKGFFKKIMGVASTQTSLIEAGSGGICQPLRRVTSLSGPH